MVEITNGIKLNMTRGYCEICDEEGINGGLSDDVVPSENHLNGTVCRKHADTRH